MKFRINLDRVNKNHIEHYYNNLRSNYLETDFVSTRPMHFGKYIVSKFYLRIDVEINIQCVRPIVFASDGIIKSTDENETYRILQEVIYGRAVKVLDAIAIASWIASPCALHFGPFQTTIDEKQILHTNFAWAVCG
jgi:hypothetical protein